MGVGVAASDEIVALAGRVQPSVVQVVAGNQGAGAGLIWRAGGAILTNHHVVARQRQIRVSLRDGRTLPARVAEQNATLDLALLEVEATDLPAALVDDSSTLRVGEIVLAIGHPWGQRGTVTAGIVSGMGTINIGPAGQRAGYIRSDVRLAPGNSGGPLLNARGAVVGINAMISGGDLSVAIPSLVASAWVAGLPSRRVSLGLSLQPVEVPASLAESQNGSIRALMVVELGQHQASHLLVGDVLLEVAGQPVPDEETLVRALSSHQARDRVRLRLIRGGALQAIELEVGMLEQAT
jgi:serine protease Do